MTLATYETDFYQWTQQQAALLRQGEFNRVDLDLENIAEEIESMGKSNRWALESYLQNVLMHLLKWQYQPQRRGTSWRLSIRNGRQHIQRLLRESPSLTPQLPAILEEEYPPARENAADETGLPLTVFPDQCPLSLEQITGDYWPE